jgi:mannose-6-phosphate isomerase-like protein (cupin superfamily)
MSTQPSGSSERLASSAAHQLLVAADDTSRRFTIVALTLPPHHPGTPPHVHAANAEGCYVLAGTLALTQGDRTMMLSAGSAAHTPATLTHSIWNPTAAPTTVLLIYTPGVPASAVDVVIAGAPEDAPPFRDTS